MSREAKPAFSPGPMVSCISARRITNYLVRAKIYPLERFAGSRQCKKRKCEVWTNVTETDTSSSTVTEEIFQINHELNCNNKCLVYLLNCKVCKKQYIGETADAFRLRWNNYKDNDRKFQRNEICMQQHFYVHVYSEGHNRFLGNISISLIYKIDGF